MGFQEEHFRQLITGASGPHEDSSPLKQFSQTTLANGIRTTLNCGPIKAHKILASKRYLYQVAIDMQVLVDTMSYNNQQESIHQLIKYCDEAIMLLDTDNPRHRDYIHILEGLSRALIPENLDLLTLGQLKVLLQKVIMKKIFLMY